MEHNSVSTLEHYSTSKLVHFSVGVNMEVACVKQLYEDFLKLGLGVIFIAVFIIGPVLIAIAPAVLVVCGIFVVILPVLLLAKAIFQGLAKRNENLRQDPRLRQ